MVKTSTKVIIADPYKDNGDMIGKILKAKGCLVKVATNVDKFNEALNDSPDLIIIEEPLSEFIELLREKPKSKLPQLVLIRFLHEQQSSLDEFVVRQLH